MKKVIIMIWFLVGMIQWNYAQMMKPSIMVVPSDNWCKEKGFMIEDEDASYPDYQKAIINSSDLLNVISMINTIMSDRGFPLENLETVLKAVKRENVERILYTSKDGNVLRANPLDDLYRMASADITLQLTWNVNKNGPKNSITFNLQALDSYTFKQVAGVEGTGNPSFSADIPVLLEEAVRNHMDMFCNRLLQYFKDMREKGREINIDVCLAESADFDFTTEYGDYELMEVITGMIAKESVNRSFSRGPSTETLLQFKNVRIPIKDENGIPMDAYAFGRKIVRSLKKEMYDIDVKVIAKGLGKAVLIIGNE